MDNFVLTKFIRMLVLPALAFAFLLSGTANAQSNTRIENRWQRDYIHNQYGAPEAGAILPNWASAKWKVETAGGGQYFRFKSAYTGAYLHNQNGKLELGPIQPGWWSAMWQAEEAGGGFVRFKNRWKSTYLYMESDGTLTAGAIPEPNYLPAQWRLTDSWDPINNLKLSGLEQQCFDTIDGLVPSGRAPAIFAASMESFAAARGNGPLLSLPRWLTLEEMQEFRTEWRQQWASHTNLNWNRNFQKREEVKRYCATGWLQHAYQIPGRVYCFARDAIPSRRDDCMSAFNDPRIEKAKDQETVRKTEERKRLANEALKTIRNPQLSDWTRPCTGTSVLKHLGSDRRITLENKSAQTLYVSVIGFSTNRLNKASLPKQRYRVIAPGGRQTIELKAPYSREYTYTYSDVLVYDDETKASRGNTLNWFRQTMVGLRDFAQAQQSDVSSAIQKAVRDKLLNGRTPPTPTLERVVDAGIVGAAGFCSGTTYELWGSQAPLWVKSAL
ncbi:RICIN domain-containing protein [Erythrobacter crassostreae]|uniref:RICIN domain-containing protein n=1 Tax=Erythrobacter crassostreae TaxID=2828328 RepID=A0A9X1F3F1_9SPHN|nr:RICIN domain-containing protein [Erythrobacter crassostrea]MBV7258994.1 RICIN domain-containing protein [Erythrobacter crassostrea]